MSMTVRINVFEAVCALVAQKLPTVEVEDITLGIDDDGFVEATLVPRQAPAPAAKPPTPTLDDLVAQTATAAAPRLPKASRVQEVVEEFDPDDVPEDDELQASAAPRATGAAVPKHRRPVPLPRRLGKFDQE